MTEKELMYHRYYMDLARRAAKMSYCERLKVGAIMVKGRTIIADGWNGMPSGEKNCCEENGVTKPEVSHAEENLIGKVSQSTYSSTGSVVYCTHSPCVHCSKLLNNAGISMFVYETDYRSDAGLEYLQNRGIEIIKLEVNNDNS